MNEQKGRWDDLRVVRAIAETGSLSGAGRQLGLSHATVFRRLGETETRLGVRLFERARGGYSPTPAGEDLAATAGRVEAEVLEVERRLAGQDLRPAGSLRVTTTDTLLSGLLSPLFTEFRQAFPEIALEVALSNNLFNLSRREADIAIRPAQDPPDTLVGRRIGVIAQAVYGHTELLEGHSETYDLMSFSWIGPDEVMGYRPLERWMERQGLQPCCHYRLDSLLAMTAAARDGAGLAVLPSYLGDSAPELRCLGAPIPELATDLWLLTHPDLRRVARIRAFLDFIAEAVQREAPRLNP
ncbi:LysR family transcriptional regulator [Fodinicurvata fenggangensis]|uniref:LysR family transcriptional regulator n=1 Tax=Fodinicurvata fenggangensis TaxID=1121830 RepID=UPI000478AE20|nr:LysR family transcriptional regulator [Fodinicurvata fenggangensis]